MSRPKLLFLVTEDWFFRSHFLPIARRAIADGYECVVAARNTGALDNIAEVRLVDMPFARRAFAPWELIRQISWLRDIVARERPTLIHAIALKPIVLLTLADLKDVAQVLALTGQGHLALARTPWTRLVRWRLQRALRRALRWPRTLLMVENMRDAAWVAQGEPLEAHKIALMPGAGVDPDRFTVALEPPAGDVVVGVVSRLIHSKGIDVAVEAVRKLREDGFAIALRIAGAPDEQNPECIGDAQLARWRDFDGIELLGHQSDINAFWARCHIACLPSRGGEGLPRSLIEAAACARPVVTTNTPGCADFVGSGEIGLVVEPGCAEALAAALKRMALDGELRQRMGASGREKVLLGYTEAHAGATASAAWRRIASRSGQCVSE